MAGLRLIGNPGAVSLTAATAKTVIMVKAPTNQRLVVLEWTVAFNGTATTNTPVTVELVRYSSDGTMSALTARKTNPSLPETIQSTWTHTASSEPSVSEVLDTFLVHPQTGHVYPLPLTREWEVPGAGRFGIKCTAAQSVSVVPRLVAEE
jgi:hypothetical protein